MKFINKQYVRWDDLDAIGHVNHAKYLTFAQEARFAMLGFFNMVVARAEADYKAPIAEGNTFIDVTMWVESIGTSSFVLVYEISKDGTLYARIKTVQVTVTEDTKNSRPLSDVQREVLKKYIETE
ncbi:MAG: thioesterase family protein [Candidatus Planktophila sp.]|nr:thioesterase family protein [Candidatus Planktophila sp.]